MLRPSPRPSTRLAGEERCRPADATSAQMVEELRLIISSPDSADVEAVCGAAVKALNARMQTPGRQRQVYVYDLGGQYAVEDPDQRAGEYRMLRIFSLQWELRGDVLLY